MQRKALGKGLSALIPDRPRTVEGQVAGILQIPVEKIVPNPRQPRKDFDAAGLAELADSVKARGVIQPVLVREGSGGFELIAGERRWRAAKKAGITSIPAIIRNVSEKDSLQMALIENLQREDLNPMESAEAYERLARDFGMTQEDVARAVGKNRSTVTNMMRLLTLPPEIKEYLRRDSLSLGHAKAILSLKGRARILSAGREIVRRGLSVREAERLARTMTADRSAARRPPKRGGDVHLRAMEEELKGRLGTRVRIVEGKKGGRIEIEYYSGEERERLLTLLRGPEPK